MDRNVAPAAAGASAPLPRWRTAWITGASTGIGRELAAKLAAQGVRVAVTARSAEKLAQLAAEHRGIVAIPADVTIPQQMAAAHAEIERALGPIDLAVLNAGIWSPMGGTNYDGASALHSMAVNYGGIVNALDAVLPSMIARGHGHLALVASVAGYRGLPKAAAYAPTKAAVISLAEVLRLDLQRHGIVVSVVNPGFVETPMTAVNDFPMPYILQAPDAAARILRGLEAKRFEIAFPWQLVWMLKLMRILPYPLYFRLVNSFVGGR